MYKPIVYVVFLLAIYCSDLIVFYNAATITDTYKNFSETIFDGGSLYLRDNFSQSVYRFALSIPTIVIFILALGIYSARDLKDKIKQLFTIGGITLFLFLLLFLHLNSRSQNSSALTYALLSYTSMITLVLREQMIFVTQGMFSRSSRHFYVISIIGLFLFIFSHKLVLTEGRVLATILIINLWIYTTKSMNIWHGVAIHAFWNYGFPQSALFHYFIFAYSFWLAFGQFDYPSILTSPISKLMQNSVGRSLLTGWRQFWLAPTRTYASLYNRLSHFIGKKWP